MHSATRLVAILSATTLLLAAVAASVHAAPRSGASARIESLVERSEGQRDDPEAVLAITDEALQLLATLPNPAAEVRILASRSLAREAQGTYPDALADAQRAEKIARTLGDDTLLGLATYQLASVEWRMANYSSALIRATRARDLLAGSDRQETRIRSVSLIGAIHHAQGDLQRGLQGYLEALQLAEALGSEVAAARAHNNIGLVYLELGRGDDGLTALERALAIHERLGPRENLANTLNNIGLALIELDRPREALPYLSRVLELDLAARNLFGQAKALSNIGYAHEKLQESARALEFHRQALALREQIGDRDGLVRTIGAIAEVRLRMGAATEAIGLFERSIALARQIGSRRDEADQLGLLAQAQMAAGDAASAYGTQREFHERQTALAEDNSRQRLLEMETLYRVRERQRDLDAAQQLAESRRRWLLTLSVGTALLVAIVLLGGALQLLRRRARRALAESELRYRTLLHSSVVPTFCVDRASRSIVDMNPPARVLLGRAVEAGSLAISDIASEQVRIALESQLARDSSDPIADDHCWVDQSGVTRWIEMRGSAVQFEGRRCLLVMLRDATDDHRREEARQREDRVRSLGALAGGIAHDFNNALMAILGHVSLARLAGQPDQQEYLEKAEQAVVDASRLTRQLLTFAKGGQPIRRPTDISRLLPDAVALAEAGTKATVKLEVADGLLQANVDSGQFSQVVSNLVLNALEATGRRGNVCVRASNHSGHDVPDLAPAPHGYVRVDVEDDGPGVADELRSRVFDPYVTTKPGGSGIGLATAHSICRQHGGALTLRSRLGEGATFSAFFPAVPASPEPAQRPTVIPDGQGAILVLEDEPMVQSVLQRMLESWGYAVEVCADGADAVRRHRERFERGQPFELLIMDLTIPGGMGGRAAMAEILELEPGARAIVASGYADDPTMADCRAAGFQAALAKPFRSDELARAITTVLGGATR